MNKEWLLRALNSYFAIGNSYTYELMRDKEGFAIDTVTLDDFREWNEEDTSALADLIIEAMKPRVLTLEEAEDRIGDYIHIEIKGKNVGEYRMLGELDSYSRKYRYLYVLHPGGAHCTPYSYNFINKIWRPWSAQPTEEQMRETPWEGEEDHEA